MGVFHVFQIVRMVPNCAKHQNYVLMVQLFFYWLGSDFLLLLESEVSQIIETAPIFLSSEFSYLEST